MNKAPCTQARCPLQALTQYISTLIENTTFSCIFGCPKGPELLVEFFGALQLHFQVPKGLDFWPLPVLGIFPPYWSKRANTPYSNGIQISFIIMKVGYCWLHYTRTCLSWAILSSFELCVCLFLSCCTYVLHFSLMKRALDFALKLQELLIIMCAYANKYYICSQNSFLKIIY